VGQVDILTKESIWELKCTKKLSSENVLQLALYYFLFRLKHPKTKKTLKLFNLLTGEIQQINVEPENLEKIFFSIYKKKYGSEDKSLTDQEFVDLNLFF